MADLPPTEIRFQVEFWSGDHPHDLNRLLVHLELGQVECDINTFIYPVMWPAARGFDPPINDLSLHWVPWDEELTSEKVIHFYVADISMYNELATLAHHLNGQIGMVSDQAPRVHRDHAARGTPGSSHLHDGTTWTAVAASPRFRSPCAGLGSHSSISPQPSWPLTIPTFGSVRALQEIRMLLSAEIDQCILRHACGLKKVCGLL